MNRFVQFQQMLGTYLNNRQAVYVDATKVSHFWGWTEYQPDGSSQERSYIVVDGASLAVAESVDIVRACLEGVA